MKVNINLVKNFVSQYNKLQAEFGTEIARLNGFDDGQLSYTDFIDNFVDEDTVADASIDGNSNVGHKDIVTLEREMSKPHSKLLAFNKIYYEINKKFGFKIANDWLRMEWMGMLYMHDAPSTTFKHYCFAYDLKDLAEKGLYFNEGLNALPAKHLITFVDFVKEFISYAANRSSGAVGLPNLIPYMFYFWKKDIDNDYLGIKTSGNEEYYAKQNIQRFVYAANQSYVRDGSQSAFTNTSIFDHPYFEALFGGSVFPDGSFMIDYEEEIIEFQKWFLDVISEIRSVNMFTFPVNSISLLRQNGKFVNEEFAKYAVRHNMKWSDSNLFVDSSVNSLSNCCFDGKQIIRCRNKNGEYQCSFKELYDMGFSKDDSLEVPIYGEWRKCKLITQPVRPMYHIVVGDDKDVYCTDNHLFPIGKKDGDVHCTDTMARDIKVGDLIPVYFWDKGFSEGMPVTFVERYEYKGNVTYCFEIEEQFAPYFALDNGVIAHNCRLKSNIENLGYFNSIGGSALKVGSVKVNTVNLARIALDSKTEEEYLDNLKYRTYVCLCALDAVRHIIQRNVEKGILPNFTYGLVDFKHLYNTVGFLGVYESMKKFGYTKKDEFGNTYYTDKASAFGDKIFKTMREVADDFLKEYECDYQVNNEQIPGEQAASKLMQKDKFFYPRAKIYDLPLYGNQFIPLGIQTTLQERVRIQAMFDSYCNGGSILHANIDAPFDSFDKAWKMVNYIADQGVTYFAFNTKIQACESNHAFYGKTCPVCGKPVASEYTRIVGFYTKINDWSHERKDEYKLRRWEPINETSEKIG